MDDSKTRSPTVRSADTMTWSPIAAGVGARSQVLLGPEDGAPNFVMRRFSMESGGGMPLHTNRVEHEQFVLQGRARITIADRDYEVSTGDVLYIPGGVPHAYEVLDGPFEFLCLVPNGPDCVELVKG